MDSLIPMRSMRPRLLFPVKPAPNETLLGFVVRALSQNHLGTPVAFMRNVGLDMNIKGDFLSRLHAKLPEIADALSMPPEALQVLWGAEPLSPNGKRRLGGVFLRPALVEQGSLRIPSSISDDAVHDARWMIKPIEFCSKSWELLVDRCPGTRCQETLTWPRAESLHICQRCGRSIRDESPKRIPKKYRASLQWVLDFFDEDPVVRDTAFKQVPTFFRVESETDAFEIVLAMRNLVCLALTKTNRIKQTPSWMHWVVASNFIRSHPASLWDLLQASSFYNRSALPNLFRRVARDSNVPIVVSEFTRLSSEDYSMLWAVPYEGDYDLLGAREVAKILSITPSQLKSLTEEKYITPISTAGVRRKRNRYEKEDVAYLEMKLGDRCSWSSLIESINIPVMAIEQFLSMGIIEKSNHKEVDLLFGSRQLSSESTKKLISKLKYVRRRKDHHLFISIEQAFLGVGAREKPWGPVLGAALRNTLPGGLSNCGDWGDLQYGINGAVAHSMVMGGPQSRPWYNFETHQYGALWRDWLAAGETQSYLNCSAVEISFLRERKLLVPRDDEYKNRYSRAEVHDFALKWMHTREAAARCAITPRDMWGVIRQFQQTDTLGRGFFLRDEMEEIVLLESANRHSNWLNTSD